MKILNSISLCLLSITGFVAVASQQQARQEGRPADKDKISMLAEQVDRLENRVERLEGVLFSTAKLSVERAEKLLSEAERQFNDSKQLHARGMITQAKLNGDRFLVEQALQELKLAKAESNQRGISNDLDVLNAQRRLKEAKEQLQFTRNLEFKGYASKEQLDRAQRAVNDREKALRLAEQKLKAAEGLEQLDRSKK